MTTTDYRPVSCDLHSECELLAMQRVRVSLEAFDAAGKVLLVNGRVADVCTRDGAEYLQLITDTGEPVAYRLDRLLTLRREDGRQILGQG